MANAIKGEVAFEDGDKQFKFVLGTYAQVVLETAAEESWGAFWQRHKEWNATDVFRLFCSGLARHHEDMGAKEMSDLMDALGPARVAEIVNEAMLKAMPKAINGAPARPTKAKPA